MDYRKKGGHLVGGYSLEGDYSWTEEDEHYAVIVSVFRFPAGTWSARNLNILCCFRSRHWDTSATAPCVSFG